MNRMAQLKLLATYNRWMNEKIYAACRNLPEAELQRDRGAFFKSIFGTLNHLAVGDTLWLKRFVNFVPTMANHPTLPQLASPTSLDGHLFESFEQLAAYRLLLDAFILDLVDVIPDALLDQPFSFVTTKGVPVTKDFFGTLTHFFNHQTHHRGQTTTLLTQQGVDVGVTDLLMLLQD